jgi:hypothetical protein
MPVHFMALLRWIGISRFFSTLLEPLTLTYPLAYVEVTGWGFLIFKSACHLCSAEYTSIYESGSDDNSYVLAIYELKHVTDTM